MNRSQNQIGKEEKFVGTGLMAKQVAIVDYKMCHPEECTEGVCLSVGACPKKVLKQEEPYEMPYINPAICVGCGLCLDSCPCRAIRMM